MSVVATSSLLYMQVATQAKSHLVNLYSFRINGTYNLEQRMDGRAIKQRSHIRALTSIYEEVYGDLDRKSSAYHRETWSSMAY